VKGKTEFLVNQSDIEQAVKLGYEIPEPVTKIIDFNFDLNGVVAFFINFEGNINISLFGEMWTILHDEKIIEALEKHLNGKSICNG